MDTLKHASQRKQKNKSNRRRRESEDKLQFTLKCAKRFGHERSIYQRKALSEKQPLINIFHPDLKMTDYVVLWWWWVFSPLLRDPVQNGSSRKSN